MAPQTTLSVSFMVCITMATFFGFWTFQALNDLDCTNSSTPISVESMTDHMVIENKFQMHYDIPQPTTKHVVK